MGSAKPRHRPPGYENAIAERVNRLLKTDFSLNRVFTTFEEAEKAVDRGVYT